MKKVLIIFLYLLVITNVAANSAERHPREEKKNSIGLSIKQTLVDDQNDWSTELEFHRMFSFPFGFSTIYEQTRNTTQKEIVNQFYLLLTYNLSYNLQIAVGPGTYYLRHFGSYADARFILEYIFQIDENFEFGPNVTFDIFDSPRGTDTDWEFGVTLSRKFNF